MAEYTDRIEDPIPFQKTLTFKLFVSYCLVVLVTILTTLAIHHLGVRRHMSTIFKHESKLLAEELKPEVQKYLAEDQSENLEDFLKFAQASARYGVSFVSLESKQWDSQPPFLLTEEERELLLRGNSLDGSAENRIDMNSLPEIPPPTRGPRGPWKENVHESRPDSHTPKRTRPALNVKLNNFVAVPLSRDGKVVGSLIVYDTVPAVSRRSRMLLQTASNGMVIALFPALLCALFLARNITRPVRRMEIVAQEYSAGNFSTRTNLQREDELGVLANAFDHMASELEENVATRTRLLTDVSHEIGTPISTIRATLEALMDRLVAPEQNDFYLQSSLNELEHLSRIFSDITELSRFETGEIRIEKDVFRAEKPVQQSVDAALILARRKNIRVEILESDRDLKAEGDLLRITQVLKNLVMNAVQHNPEGTIVRAFWSATPSQVTFTVQDNGTHISDEHAKHIFERFYKISQSRTRDDSSSGLGLAIVSRILRGHDTEIQFANTSDGKFFSFTLPRV